MRVFLFAAVCFLMVSCFDEGDCVFTATNMLRIDFMDVTSVKKEKAIIIDSLAIPGRVFFTQKDTVTNVILPIDPETNETAFVFYHDATADTLVFGYTMKTQVLSPDCGTFPYYNDLTIKYNTFPDSINIVNPSLRIDFVNTAHPVLTNVQIFH